ncbi:MAG: diiron oxygenase [Pseudomonadales bacterium]|nr:diiron oxygenase [Pseudomonadales bacterium]
MTSYITASTGYSHQLTKLSEASTKKFYLPYTDIDWEADEYQISCEDNSWGDMTHSFLGQTRWYANQPQSIKNKIGLQYDVNTTSLGISFENLLTRGLLAFASTLPTGSQEYRYAMHEAIEECHHSMMFQEFINRSGVEPQAHAWLTRFLGIGVDSLARNFPELFFIFVLGGEAPIDYVQRRTLSEHNNLHPLVKKMMHIHTTEEARHISFAEHFLQEHVPQLGKIKKARISIATPIIFSIMANMMLKPSATMIRKFNIPNEVIKEAYDNNPDYHHYIIQSFESVAGFCKELGLINQYSRLLWQRFFYRNSDNNVLELKELE